MVLFTVHCRCGEAYHVEQEDIGRGLRCLRCGQVFPITGPDKERRTTKAHAHTTGADPRATMPNARTTNADHPTTNAVTGTACAATRIAATREPGSTRTRRSAHSHRFAWSMIKLAALAILSLLVLAFFSVTREAPPPPAMNRPYSPPALQTTTPSIEEPSGSVRSSALVSKPASSEPDTEAGTSDRGPRPVASTSGVTPAPNTAPSPSQRVFGQVTGRLVFGDTEIPISPATITVGSVTAEADWRGQFVLFGLPPGTAIAIIKSYVGTTSIPVSVSEDGSGKIGAVRISAPEFWDQQEFIQAAADEKGKTRRWDRTELKYWFHPSCSPSLRTTVVEATNQLRKETALFAFSEVPRHEEADLRFTEKSSLGQNLGYARTLSKANVLFEAEIEIARSAATDGNVIKHELIHALGLNHLEREGYIMQQTDDGAGLSTNEINYLRVLYSIPPGTVIK